MMRYKPSDTYVGGDARLVIGTMRLMSGLSMSRRSKIVLNEGIMRREVYLQDIMDLDDWERDYF